MGRFLTWPTVLLAICSIAVSIWLHGRYTGRMDERLVHAGQVAAEVQQAHEQYQAEVGRGQRAEQQLRNRITDLLATQINAERLTAHVPRFVASQSCPAPGRVELSRAGVLRVNAALGHPELPTSAASVPGAAAGVGAPAPTASELAGLGAGSGVYVEQLATNAEVNYGRCTQIRARCLALIDFIKARPVAGQSVDQQEAP